MPAVFRLLRPEFREQLKQSSCKVAIPDEDSSKERIIPIRREGEDPSPADRILPISLVSPTKNGVNNNVTSEGGESKERVIPIRRENGGGGSSVTPKRPAGLVAPKVNGFSPAQQASAMGLRQNGVSKPSPTAEARNGKGSDQKQSVVRKLSPLSPKHIVVPPSSGEKPAITPKPEHLKSPPMSPTPPASPSSPPTPVRSQTSPVSSPSQPAKEEVVVEETPTQVEEDTVSPIEVTPSPPLATIVPQTLNNNINNNNNNNNKEKEVESPSLASPRSLDSSYEDNEEEYPEEFYEQYQHQPTGGLRERELLCPIMEEDNESTASGSTCNLATPRDNNTVIGEQQH